MAELSHMMLSKNRLRQYIIEKAKKPLRLALVSIAKRWPEPTRENCSAPNTGILFDLWDEFKKHDRSGPARVAMFDAVFKIFICEYEHDHHYRSRFDWAFMFLKESDWLHRYKHPRPRWLIDRS